MAHVLSMVVDGVGGFVKTLWGLQERRWSYTFDVVASAAVSVTMTFVLCLLSIRSNHRHRRASNMNRIHPRPEQWIKDSGWSKFVFTIIEYGKVVKYGMNYYGSISSSSICVGGAHTIFLIFWIKRIKQKPIKRVNMRTPSTFPN